MSESSLTICEECGGKIERIITGGTGLIFKGSGFYLTDYKDGEKKDGEKLNSNTEKKVEGNTEKSKTDKKETKSSQSENKLTSKKADKSDD